MTLKECSIDARVTRQTVYLWVKSGKLKTKNIGLRSIYVEPQVWEEFCIENNMKRGEK